MPSKAQVGTLPDTHILLNQLAIEIRRWRRLMTKPPQNRDTLIGMKHDWISEGTEVGIGRQWCENCSWEREQSQDQVWYRRDIGQLVKRHWLLQWWSSPTAIVQWSDTEPECASEKKKPRPAFTARGLRRDCQLHASRVRARMAASSACRLFTSRL